MTQNKKHTYKLAIVGEAGVGKSSIVDRIVRNTFTGQASSTIGAAYSTYKYGLKNTYQIWDTAGQERYQALIPMYLRDSKIVLVVYDITNMHSLDRIKDHWYDFVINNVGDDTFIILIANKWDIIRSRSDHVEREASRFAESKGLYHLQVSAKDGTNISTIFKTVDGHIEQCERDRQAQGYDDSEIDEDTKSGSVLVDWDSLLNPNRRNRDGVFSSCGGNCNIQ